jgi:serine O-acetyltransferase
MTELYHFGYTRGMSDFDSTSYADNLLSTYNRAKGQAQYYLLKRIPEMKLMRLLSKDIMELMFPGRSGDCPEDCTLDSVVRRELAEVCDILLEQIAIAYTYDKPEEDEASHRAKAKEDVIALCEALPSIRRMLKLDAVAGYEGDPAAGSVREVILSYPCMKALTIYRVAHVLYIRKVPLIPRMLTELAHAETGIDINPGAQIGESFFIDHGTGVVIGETTIIGNHVKMYQGVTLGALSFPRDACGLLIRGTKRHPTIQDNVTIYSHATILGDITIGKNAVIGAGVWIKNDVPPDTMAMLDPPKITYRDLSKRKTGQPDIS